MKKLMIVLVVLFAVGSVFGADNDNCDVTWIIPAVNDIQIDDVAIALGTLNHTIGNANFDNASNTGTYDYASNMATARKITAELTVADVVAGNLFINLDDPNTGALAGEVEITSTFTGAAVDAVTDISADSDENLTIGFEIKNVPASTTAANISHNCKLTIVAN
ncbi:MAG: hypothetical protein U9N76_06825 [Candidatus Marinimicrobia bacterium]|nr:hypothetical protein [Candidatus Neomarinimicrobiota bacterium]